MKSYPKINYYHKFQGQHITAFDKLDGSNIRFEWSKKRGWYKSGSRRTLIDENHDFLGEAVTIFNEKYADDLAKVFKDNKNYRHARNMVVFLEFLGPNSFAGQHESEDEKDLILIDVNQFQKDLLPYNQFIKDFGHLHIPEIVYQGILDHQFLEDIKQNKYNLDEGVIAKGIQNQKPFMCKVKTLEWLRKVKEKMGQKFIYEDLNGNQELISEV